RCPDMVDTYVVAEASIYSPDDTPKIGLYFVVTGQDLKLDGITKETAIVEARRIRPEIVEEWRARAETPKETIQVVYSWRGQYVAERLAKA
ncbi:MAG: hypothetical protein ACE5JO_10370, partial [Candidatus Binatia bacterium]